MPLASRKTPPSFYMKGVEESKSVEEQRLAHGFKDSNIERDSQQADPQIPFEKLDNYFVGKLLKENPIDAEIVKASDYWDTKLRIPSGYYSIRAEGRFYTRFPYISWYGTLPDLTPYFEAGTRSEWFSPVKTEQGHSGGHHGASFSVHPLSKTSQEYVAQTWMTNQAGAGQRLAVNNMVPDDVLTAGHTYQLYLHRNAVEWYIDSDLIAVQVPSNTNSAVSNNSPPYAVGTFKGTWRPISVVMTDAWVPQNQEVEIDYDVRDLFFLPGEPAPPRTYRLYDLEADTLMTSGTYDTGTSYKSHPVPVQGYDSKTLLFRADTDSVTDGLQIEVYTQAGNWRVYDTVTASANSLESYIITGDFPLVRIGYEPSADGASITDAEVTMN